MEIKLTFEEHGFKGHVTMRVAKNSQRLRFFGAIGLNPDGIDEENVEENFSNLEMIGNLIEKSEEFYVEVDLNNGKKKFKSFEDLDNDMSCQTIQMECATKAIMGLGSKEKKSKS
jgi:hypothetical protein